LAIGFLAAGSIKVIGTKTSIQMRDHVAVAAALWRVIGALELAAAAGLVAGLFNPALGVAAAIGVSLLLAGAVVAHLRVDDAGGAAPALVRVCLRHAMARRLRLQEIRLSPHRAVRNARRGTIGPARRTRDHSLSLGGNACRIAPSPTSAGHLTLSPVR
jgi:DoxX-like family